MKSFSTNKDLTRSTEKKQQQQGKNDQQKKSDSSKVKTINRKKATAVRQKRSTEKKHQQQGKNDQQEKEQYQQGKKCFSCTGLTFLELF